MTDWELLRRYVEHDDEQAFLRIVERHQDFVFACAKRQAGDESTAEDVAQGVFLLLARKAPRISSGVVLTSWLFRATRYSALAALRARRRRETYERESAMHRPDSSEPGWMRLAPHLDAALDRLSEADRSALLLRYFRRQSLREVGDALGIGEEAARKRVDRAAGKLRETLLRSGVTLSMAAVLALITANRTEAAPVGFGERFSSALRAPVTAPGSHLAHEAGRRWLARSLLPWAVICLLLLLVTGAFALKRGPRPADGLPVVAMETSREPETGVNAIPETLPPYHRMIVRVVDAATDRPLANCEVRYDLGIGVASQTTDARGEAVIPFPETEAVFFQFTAWTPGYISKSVRWGWSEWESLPPQYTVRIRKGVLTRGTVVDESDQPIAGVTVTPTWGTSLENSREHEGVRQTAHIATSDEAGRWEILMIPTPTNSERVQLHAAHINYATATAELHPDMFPLTNTMKLVLSNGFVFKGVVMTPEGVPIVGASVEARVRPGFKTTLTDREGRFELPHLPSSDRSIYGWMGFKARADGYRPWEKSINTKSNMHDVVITLQPLPNVGTALLRGRITYDDGQPIPGNFFLSTVSSVPAAVYRSDQDGLFTATNVPVGTSDFTVLFGGLDPVRVKLTADGTEQKIDIPKPEVLRIEGTIVDQISGQPVPEFDVLLTSGNDLNEISAYDSTLLGSGLNGKFALRCRPSSVRGNNPHLLFKAKGYWTDLVAISTKSNQMQVNLALDSICALAVKIFQPDGTPAVGARGGFSFSRKAPINKNGEFTPIPTAKTPAIIYTADSKGILTTPPPDPTLLQLTVVHPSGYGKVLMKARSNDTLQLSPWASVKGVLKIGGKPAAGILLGLTCSPYHYPYDAETTTDSEGRFLFDRVPDGRWTLARRYLQNQQYETSSLYILDLVAGQEADLVVGESGIRVAGRLVRNSARNGFDPSLDLMGLHSPDQTREKARTFQVPINPDGTFVFDDVIPGEYMLRGIRLRGYYEPVENFLSQKITISESPSDLDLGNLTIP